MTAAVAAASIATAGCATYGPGYGYNNGYYDQYGNYVPYNGYGYNNSGAGIATGAAVGAVGGAILGHSVGLGTVGGAVAGAVLGGVLGAVINGRQYYRDTRGYCYYVDQYGQPHYSYDIRC
ncbi:MAG TPA: hypothetical protein VF776_07880 [Sphingomicrobium sp.]